MELSIHGVIDSAQDSRIISEEKPLRLTESKTNTCMHLLEEDKRTELSHKLAKNKKSLMGHLSAPAKYIFLHGRQSGATYLKDVLRRNPNFVLA